MSGEWVDFKAVKAAVTMQMVLDRYGINNLTKSGDELRGPCPIHKGSKRNKIFAVNIRKNAFKCFFAGCGSGNVLDFVAAMEGCSARDAAVKLQDWFKIGESQASTQSEDETSTVAVCRGIYQNESGGLFEVIATAAKLDDLQELVIYRELFGEFQFRLAQPEIFDQESRVEGTDGLSILTLIKPL
jgi:DNA primase